MAIISNAVTIADAGAFSVSLGSLVHIKTLTASGSSTLSFVHGASDVVLDGTYPIYQFKFIDIHPSETGELNFLFNLSSDSGSNYNVTKTTTVFKAQHGEDDNNANMEYVASKDLAQGTGFQALSMDLGYGNDESLSGSLTLFNPSSTTFVKHFIARTTHYMYSSRAVDFYGAGYGNTTSAVNAIRFQINSGNIDAGKIKLYGIKDS
jgi:hypothetical protein